MALRAKRRQSGHNGILVHPRTGLTDDSEELLDWSMKAFEAAERADQKKPPSRRKLNN